MDNNDKLKTMFPGEEVTFPDGSKVKITPLTLEHLPKILDSFGSLLTLVKGDTDPAEVAVKGLGELLKIIPYCIDCEASELPVDRIPDVMEIIVKQNFSGESLGKWTTLMLKAQGLIEKGHQSIKDSQT